MRRYLIIAALLLCLCLCSCEKEEAPVSGLYLQAVSGRLETCQGEDDAFTFKALAQDALGKVSYSWYACDAKGNLQGDTPVCLSEEDSLTVEGLSDSLIGRSVYYICFAKDDAAEVGLIFSCVRQEAPPVLNFLELHAGTWTQLQTGDFFVIGYDSDDNTTLSFGNWILQAEPSGGRAFVESVGDDGTALIGCEMQAEAQEDPAGEGEEDTGAGAEEEFKTVYFSMTEKDSINIMLSGGTLEEGAVLCFTYDEFYQYPDPINEFVPEAAGETQPDEGTEDNTENSEGETEGAEEN